MAMQLRKPVFNKLKDIEPMKRYNVTVKVLKVENTTKIKRIDADPVDIAICLVGDETGCGRVMLKNVQVQFAKEGNTLILRNALARIVKERLRLEVDIWGKVEKTEVTFFGGGGIILWIIDGNQGGEYEEQYLGSGIRGCSG